jgi:hypothetical protein
VRALANIIVRFFEPLWDLLGATSTSDILIVQNKVVIQKRLIDFGGIGDFHANKEQFINKILEVSKTIG